MGEAADQGRRLEQRMAAYFQSHGYQTECNVVLEGRSGGRHEVDVLAEKTDPLTSFRLAIECKAWQQPIEKEVISKLHYVLTDLGMNKGIVVSLAGWRAGADRTASDLGVELWGPDELRYHLGTQEVADLGVPSSSAGTTAGWGHNPRVPPQQADRAIRAAAKGRLGLRMVEQLTAQSLVWLPAYCVRLTCSQPEEQRGLLGRRRGVVHRSVTKDNVYEALSGQFLGPVRHPWEQVRSDPRVTLPAGLRESKVSGALRKAFSGYERVTSPAAMARHTSNLASLGVPTPCSSLSVDSTTLVHLPYVVGILDTSGRQRVVAVDAVTGEDAQFMSQLLTANLPQVRELLGTGGVA